MIECTLSGKRAKTHPPRVYILRVALSCKDRIAGNHQWISFKNTLKQLNDSKQQYKVQVRIKAIERKRSTTHPSTQQQASPQNGIQHWISRLLS